MNMRSVLTSRRIANMFGAMGYSVLIATYALVAGVVLMWLIQGGYDTTMLLPSEEAVEMPAEATGDDGASILVSTFAYAVTIIMMITVVFVTITLPYWLGKSGSFILRKAIRFFRIQVTPMTLLLAKLIASAIVGLPILLIVAEDIGNILTLIFVSGLTGLAAILFLLQHYLAKMIHLEAKEIL